MPGAGNIFEIIAVIFEAVAGDIGADQFNQQLMIRFYDFVFLGVKSCYSQESVRSAEESISEEEQGEHSQNPKHRPPDSVAAVGQPLHQVHAHD